MPWTMGAIVLLGLGLIGIPLTSGFISKWYLLLATIEQSNWFAAIIVVAGSLLTIIYIWKIVEYAYFKAPIEESEQSDENTKEAPLWMLIPLWVLVAANFYFGLDTSFSYGFATTAIDSLFLVNND